MNKIDEIEKKILKLQVERKNWQKKVNVFGSNNLFITNILKIESKINKLQDIRFDI